MQIEMLQDVHSLVIGKGHIIEINRPFDMFQFLTVCLILDGDRIVNGVEDTLQVRTDLGQLLDDLGQLGQGTAELGHITGKSHHDSRIHGGTAI